MDIIIKQIIGILAFGYLVFSIGYSASSQFIVYNNPISCDKILVFFVTSCRLNDLFITSNITGIGQQGPQGPAGPSPDYTNIAYLNNSQNFTGINNFTGNTYASNLNISGILYVGDNRSSFPITCSNNQFLSSLGSNGIFICTTDSDPATDYTNVAFLNNTQNWTAIQNFTLNTYMNWSYVINQNISGMLFVGQNRSVFPSSCSGTNKVVGISASGIISCGVDLNNLTDYSNIAYLNASQTFSGVQTFQDVKINGWLNVSNATTWSVFGNITAFSINGTSLNITGASWLNQTNMTDVWIKGNLNVSGNVTIGNASISYLNVSSQLFVGNNRSSFPITCSAGQFVSALASTGLFTCSADTDTPTDYTNVAFLNNTQNFTAQNTFRDLIVLGWMNITNATVFTTLNNVTAGQLNGTSLNITGWSNLGSTNITGNFNVTGNITGGVVYSNNSQTLTYSEGYRLLCNNQSSAARADIKCTGLPIYQEYQVLLFVPGTSAGENTNFRINADTTAGAYANYACNIGQSLCTSSSSTNTWQIEDNTTTNNRMVNCFVFGDPGDSITSAQCVVGVGGGRPAQIFSGSWNKNTQITEFDMIAGSGNLNANTSLKVYGVA